MKRTARIAGLVLLLGMGQCAFADTVVTKDGRRFVGEVARADTGYKVKTRFGEILVSEGDFSEWIKDGAVATPPSSGNATVARTTVGPTVAPVRPTVPASVGVKKVDPKLLGALLKQGQDALAAGEYKAARDAFHDAADVDPKNIDALHGTSVASMYLNDFVHALPPMEKALLATPTPNRALVLNMAVCQIGQPGSKNAMRAAIIIMDYLAAHPATLDEPLLNAMATALYVADDQAKKGSKFRDCEAFYKTYNQKLEAAKPGMKRWGVQWLPAKEVDEKIASNNTIDRQLASSYKDMDLLAGKIDDKTRDVNNAKDLYRRGFVSEYALNQDIRELKGLTDTLEEKQKACDDMIAKRERPSFPKAMTLVAMTDLTPPPVAASVTVAEVTQPAEALIAPPVMKRNRPKTDTTIHTEMPKADPVAEEPVIKITAQQTSHRPVHISTYAAAFPISDSLVLTMAGPVSGASDLELQSADGSSMKAELVRADEATGLALLRVTSKKLVPLILGTSFTGGAVQCPSYPTVNIFSPAAEPIPGTAKAPLADWKISLSRHPRLGGSPVMAANKVVGIELASRNTDASLVPTVPVDVIRKFLGADLPATPTGTPEPCGAMLQLIATRESSGM
jgi:hypothetical protein